MDDEGAGLCDRLGFFAAVPFESSITLVECIVQDSSLTRWEGR